MENFFYCAAAKYCKNNSNDSVLNFFEFPTADPYRCFLWIQSCGREDVLETQEYGSLKLCSAHFENKMFTNDLKNELRQNALPTLFYKETKKLSGSNFIDSIVDDHQYARPQMKEIENDITNGHSSSLDLNDVDPADKSLSSLNDEPQFTLHWGHETKSPDCISDYRSITDDLCRFVNNDESIDFDVAVNDHDYCERIEVEDDATDKKKDLRESLKNRLSTILGKHGEILHISTSESTETSNNKTSSSSNVQKDPVAYLSELITGADRGKSSISELSADQETKKSTATLPNVQTKGLIKAVIVVQGDKIKTLVPLQQPLELPKDSNVLTDINTCDIDKGTKNKIKKIVSEITGNDKNMSVQHVNMNNLSNIQKVLNLQDSNIFEANMTGVQEGKILRRLLLPLNRVQPKKRKREKKKVEKEPVKRSKKMIHPICRLCLQVSFGNYFLASGVSPKGHSIMEMLATCVPEMDHGSIHKPVLCNSCMFDLSVSYEFKIRCLQTEEKIKEYKRMSDIAPGCAIFMKNVVKKLNKIHPIATEENDNNTSDQPSTSKTQSVSCDTSQVEDRSVAVPSSTTIEEFDTNKENEYSAAEDVVEYIEKKENLVQFSFDINKVQFSNTHKESAPKRSYRQDENRANYKCYTCEKKFILEERLKLHYYRDHDISTLYRCKLCGKYFKDVFVLRQHIGHIHAICTNVNKTSV